MRKKEKSREAARTTKQHPGKNPANTTSTGCLYHSTVEARGQAKTDLQNVEAESYRAITQLQLAGFWFSVSQRQRLRWFIVNATDPQEAAERAIATGREIRSGLGITSAERLLRTLENEGDKHERY